MKQEKQAVAAKKGRKNHSSLFIGRGKKNVRLRIKLIYVLAAAFVIIAGGIMTINRLNGDIAVLQTEVTQTRLDKLKVDAKQSEMLQELAIKDTDSYIRSKARTMFRYLNQGEILFVVENLEALYEDGEMPQTAVMEDAEG